MQICKIITTKIENFNLRLMSHRSLFRRKRVEVISNGQKTYSKEFTFSTDDIKLFSERKYLESNCNDHNLFLEFSAFLWWFVSNFDKVWYDLFKKIKYSTRNTKLHINSCEYFKKHSQNECSTFFRTDNSS